MRLNVKSRIVCSISQSIIDEFVNAIDEADYDDQRSKMGNLEACTSINLRHSRQYIESILYGHSEVRSSALFGLEDYPFMQKYRPHLNKILSILREHFDWIDYAAIIAKLAPNSKIGRHSDMGQFLESCHRVHVPLITNPDVLYEVDGLIEHWSSGNIYEFNNQLPHSVLNNSDQARVHLIVNLYSQKGLDTANNRGRNESLPT